ncbi:unnamed protein product [Brassica rapa subsp. trilocularis]
MVTKWQRGKSCQMCQFHRSTKLNACGLRNASLLSFIFYTSLIYSLSFLSN